jgi:hypothetical protein
MTEKLIKLFVLSLGLLGILALDVDHVRLWHNVKQLDSLFLVVVSKSLEES